MDTNEHCSTKYSIPFILLLVYISKLTGLAGSVPLLLGTAEIFVAVGSLTKGSLSRTIADLKC